MYGGDGGGDEILDEKEEVRQDEEEEMPIVGMEWVDSIIVLARRQSRRETAESNKKRKRHKNCRRRCVLFQMYIGYKAHHNTKENVSILGEKVSVNVQL